MQSKVLFSVALLALVGCSTEKVNVGDDAPVRTGASLSDYEGSWEGYVEAYEWSDESDAIRVMLDAEGNGVLEVGEPASGPAPEVDPDGAPPYGQNPYFPGPAPQELFPGFSFPIADARVEAKRIRISTVLGEPYREWCELQTPHLDEVNTGQEAYWCLPNLGFSSSEGDQCFLGDDTEHANPIDCGKLTCLTTCKCDAEGCTLANGEQQMIFDAELESEGEELEGSLVHNGTIYTVRMTFAD